MGTFMIQTFGWLEAQLPRLVPNNLVEFLCRVYQISLNVSPLVKGQKHEKQ